jgi:hypothetical protein
MPSGRQIFSLKRVVGTGSYVEQLKLAFCVTSVLFFFTGRRKIKERREVFELNAKLQTDV